VATDFLAQLDPEFAAVVRQVLADCQTRGITMRPNSAARSPWEQAKLWRQSRATEQIQVARHQMENEGAPWLANVLAEVGPQHGDHVTNALPGKSAHQYRLAVDCFWLLNGEAEWEDTTGYRIYATVAQGLGLSAGMFWTSFVDPPHLQHGSMDNLPSRSWAMLEAEMYRIWGNTPSGQWGRP
jgi:peptidoglycan L-alanyl-D-glutamate endopeptidase CwlK